MGKTLLDYFESRKCGKCNGSGKWGHTATFWEHGGECSACKGAGKLLTGRGAKARAKYEELLSRTVESLEVGDKILDSRGVKNPVWRVVYAIESQAKGDAYTFETVDDTGRKMVFRDQPAGRLYRVAATAQGQREAMERAMDYQVELGGKRPK